MPSLSAQELSRILSQPGYAISDGSSLLITATQRPAAPTEPANMVKHTAATEKRPSAVLWASEREFQAAVIAECNMRAVLEPEFAMLVAIPNGQYRAGQRMEPGLRAGMPDLMLCCQRGPHGALFIELKVGDGKPSREQMEMHQRLRMEGYRVALVWDSVDDVMFEIARYLAL